MTFSLHLTRRDHSFLTVTSLRFLDLAFIILLRLITLLGLAYLLQNASLYCPLALRRSVFLGVALDLENSDSMNRYAEQAPETLVAFLDGRTPPSIPRPNTNTNPEPPRKRRKVTGGSAAKVLLPPAAPDDYLTLARVDLSIVGGPEKLEELRLLTRNLGISEKSKRVIPFAFFRPVRTAAGSKHRATPSSA